MLALTKAGSSVALTPVPDPMPLSHEALVKVNAFSLNRGEVEDLQKLPEGAPVGWDFAGTLQAGPADVSKLQVGMAVGGRVVGLARRRGAWAEYVAVPANWLTVLPGHVADAQACALPTAGLTALRSLEVGGFLLGKRVLVTGAGGGVGRFATQLAKAAGAQVTAFVRTAVEVPGADLVTTEVRGSYDLIVDCVGGEVFGGAIECLRPRGVLVNLATPDPDERISFRAGGFDRSAGARIYTLNNFDELTAHDSVQDDLTRLIALVAGFKLDVGVGVEAPWEETPAVIEAFLSRRITGKAVLRVH